MSNLFHTISARFIIMTVLLCISCTCLGQNLLSWEDFVERMHDNNEEYDDLIFEELQEMHNSPININTATKEELGSLPFLTTRQINDIIYYRTVNEKLLSLGELMFITSLDKFTREALMLFCYAGDIPEKKLNIRSLFKQSNNEMTLRSDYPLYKKDGFSDYSDSILTKSPNKVYSGSRTAHAFRYHLKGANHLDAGLQMEKDAGESGIDYISGYIMIHDIKKIKEAIIGNYRINFGHGLVANTGTVMGKSMMLNSIDRMGRGISKHSSTSETGYFTGGAATIKLKAFDISAYTSFQPLDGTLNNDGNSISSIKTDGYHRTKSETDKKGNIHSTDMGANILWDMDNLQLSATIAHTHLSLPLSPKHNTKASLYRLYNAHGTDFTAYSLSYSYRMSRFLFTGETASSNSGSIATLNSIQWHINSYNTITAIQRYYSCKYVSFRGKCFGENSTPQNEDGIYIGWNSDISKKFIIRTYIDGMYFPWLKYQVSNSSYGIDGAIDATYSASSVCDVNIRYKIKSKQKDYKYIYTNNSNRKDTLRVLQYNTNQNLRLSCNIRANDHLSFKTIINGTMIDFGPSPREYGFSIGESIQWSNPDNRQRFNISCTYFNTDTYNSRIYSYESSLLYSFGMTSYYYHGARLIALASFPIINNLTLTARASSTMYFNRESIGSGTDMIHSSHKEDIQMQVRWKF